MLTRRLLAALPFAAALPAHAQSWPARPVRIVIAYPPGGSTDLLGRALAQRLGETITGGAFVVDNRPGGGAIPGTEAVARAAPDGYTLALGNNQTHASNQSFSVAPLPYNERRREAMHALRGLPVEIYGPGWRKPRNGWEPAIWRRVTNNSCAS